MNEVMNEVMIDIETLSTRTDATVLTIGAVRFDRHAPPDADPDTFYRRIDRASCEVLGLHVDPDTEAWWARQSAEAQHEALHHPERVPLENALRDFAQWVGTSKLVWAKSPDFDCKILETACGRLGVTVPWKFWNVRDVRTAMDLGGVRNSDLQQGSEHTAIGDCLKQVAAVKMAVAAPKS